MRTPTEATLKTRMDGPYVQLYIEHPPGPKGEYSATPLFGMLPALWLRWLESERRKIGAEPK